MPVARQLKRSTHWHRAGSPAEQTGHEPRLIHRQTTWTCNSLLAQPRRHRRAGGLLPHLLTLTRKRRAVFFFCNSQPSPAASTFRRGMPCVAQTFLSPARAKASGQRRTGQLPYKMQIYAFYP